MCSLESQTFLQVLMDTEAFVGKLGVGMKAELPWKELGVPSKEIPGLISFRMHWLDLLAVQGTLKSLL